VLITRAELPGRGLRDLRIGAGRIQAIAPELPRRDGELHLDAAGGALLPGLHDHHLHLFALAAARRSVRCGPPALRDAGALGERLARARAATPPGGWVRGVGYHESVAGPLDRHRLDAWLPDRPLRIQHRSGALWLLNSEALARLEAERAPPPGLGRDARGAPDGRLLREDAWLRERLGREDWPPLADVGRELARLGVSGVTDATPGNGPVEARALAEALERGWLRQRVHLMGSAKLPEPLHPQLTRGPRKLVLDEPRLPDFDAFAGEIAAAHAQRRAVAIHCVTRSELVFALAALREAGCRPGDRIEHAAVADADALAGLASLPVTVVTQPNFVAERGDAYRRDVAREDHDHLYRGRGFERAGIPLAGGTDAPFGEPDPWAAMRAAVERRTPSGERLGPREALSPERALALFTTPLEAPGGAPRAVAPGARADLCLLDRPWREARRDLSGDAVAATLCGGRLTWGA
jgi:predicted amidohydrolase YtcJ